MHGKFLINLMRRVDPNVYTTEYYLTDCTGYKEFKESLGEELEPRFSEIIKYLRITPGMRVLDIGCGRGEMVLYAAKRGAKAIGIDYATEAIKLAKLVLMKQKKEIAKNMQFLIMDAKKLKFSSNSFDLIIMTDVVEHLYPEELDNVFNECKRVLKPGGKMVIHTAPNRLFNDIGYRYYSYIVGRMVVSLWNVILKKTYAHIARPEVLRTDSHHIMHINEPSYFSLKRLFKKHNFEGRIVSSNITAKKPEISFKDTFFNAVVYFHPISKNFPLNVLWGSDFVSVITNKK